MPLPVTFATLPTGNNPASLLDTEFAAVAAMGTTTCTASGVNAILLTVAPNQPVPTAYVNGHRFNFIAAASNTGAVTIQVGSLAAIPVRGGGVALGVGAILAGTIVEVVVTGNGASADLSAGPYLPLSGGSVGGPMTVNGGPMTVNGPATGNAVLLLNKAASGQQNILYGDTNTVARWAVVLGDNGAEGGSNTGSDFAIDRFSDTGVQIDSPIYIPRSTGVVNLNGLNVNGGIATINGQAAGDVSLLLNKASSGQNNTLFGDTNSVARWGLVMGNNTAETGSNVGSDCGFNRYSDAGAQIDSPILITRSNGNVTMPNTLSVYTAINISAGVTPRPFNWQTNGVFRWQMFADASPEGGSNLGSNLFLQANADSGAALATVWSIVRQTQVVSFAKAIVNGPSDRTLKENIAPLEGSLDKVKALQGVSFNFKASPEKREIGLIAQDVEPVVPEIVQEFTTTDEEGKTAEPKLALDYPKLVAVLIEAIKTLTARVEALEAASAAKLA